MKSVVERYGFMEEENKREGIVREKDKCYSWLNRMVNLYFSKKSKKFVDTEMENW